MRSLHDLGIGFLNYLSFSSHPLPFIFKRILMGKLSTGCPGMEASLVDVEARDLELCICGISRMLETQFENHSGKNGFCRQLKFEIFTFMNL